MNKVERKIISFVENSTDMEIVQKYLNEGWILTNLIQNQRNYVGIIEKHNTKSSEDLIISIMKPARKKFQYA
jgi:hypothetical protein